MLCRAAGERMMESGSKRLAGCKSAIGCAMRAMAGELTELIEVVKR
jgi:hypothetical protein